jgi:hypothetical protein
LTTAPASGGTRDEWLEQVPAFGGHSQIPPTTLDELRRHDW